VGFEHQQAQPVRGYSKRVLAELDFSRRDAACPGDKRRLFLCPFDPNFGWFFAPEPGMSRFSPKNSSKKLHFFTKKC
jgi:hypothetical protein